MEYDLEVTSTVFNYIIKNLNLEINLGYINNIQTIAEDFWRIKIHKKTTKTLYINPKVCFLSDYNVEIIENKGFAKYLKKKLNNQRIKQIYQDKNNRVVCFELDHYNLIFEFFSKSNIILTDKDFKIITSKQKEEWKDRTIKKFETYKFPEGQKIDEITTEDILDDKKQTIKYLNKKYQIAPHYLEEIIKEKINKKEIIKKIKELYEIENSNIEIIEKNNKKIAIITKGEKKLYENIEEYFLEKIKKNKTISKNTKIEKLEKIIKEQEKSKINFLEKIKILEKEGEIIYSNYIYIEEINKIIEKALKLKITEKEIIKKINTYFKEKNKNIKIMKIDQKKKTYIINI
ncbi:MAG: NFACT family protein [Candidatus ainarchaeum sp.]|nr:NFACT family protein [Candidatus ainarchaeum sp.]MDD3975841.1 NFACT family protein [Candidatus ainarchaeum sp.]